MIEFNRFLIGNREVGENCPCLIIAEIGLAHDGSLGYAHAFIDASADSGADAVKFQTHIASAESSPEEAFRVDVFPQDKTRYDYWLRTSFTESQWAELKLHAESRGLIFLSTPFSIEAVQMLRRIGIQAWKIGSGETNNLLLLDEIALSKEPVLLSSGMSYMKELDVCVKRIKNQNIPLVLMQCTNVYPCPPEKLGLNMISNYKDRYQIPIGFSDHSGEIGTALTAIALGVKVVEVHVTWDKECFGPDTKSSLTFKQLLLLVKNIRIVELALSNPINKDSITEEMEDLRLLFSKGLVAKKKISKGTIVNKDHLDGKKPCLGIPVYEYEKIIGKISNRDIPKGESIGWEDLQ